MSLESSSARAEQMARQLLSHDRLLSTAELIDKVDDVTAQSVRDFAARLAASPPAVAVVGAGRSSQKYALAAERMAQN